MGILNIVEQAAGAFAADKALEAVDPQAGLLARGAAAVAGFEGVAKITEMASDRDGSTPPQPDQAQPDPDAA